MERLEGPERETNSSRFHITAAMEHPRQKQAALLQVDLGRVMQDLFEEIVSLKLERDQLLANSSGLAARNNTLQAENSSLRSGIAALEKKVKLQEPLVENVVLIRKHLFEQMKEQRGHGVSDPSVIMSGNQAAHGGDILADVAMFELRHVSLGVGEREMLGSDGDLGKNPMVGYDTVFEDLYGSGIDHKISLDMLQKIKLPATEAEFWNLCGSMSTSSLIMTGISKREA